MNTRAGQGTFDRTNLGEVPLAKVVAHGGEQEIGFRRLVEGAQMAGGCNFIDLAVLPPGASIGRHTHAESEEEFYLIIEGTGSMWRDGYEFRVGAGDLVRNRPGGAHGLRNDGEGPLRIFVFEVVAPRSVST